MGQLQSRSLSPQDLSPGVRITQELLDQLDGKVVELRAPSLPILTPKLLPQADTEREVADAARQDPALAAALARSQRIGRQLLRAEEGELHAVEQLAEELLASEYNVPARPRPCTEAAAACQACYQEHATNPLACAAAVEAYLQCARGAWAQQAPATAAAL